MLYVTYNMCEIASQWTCVTHIFYRSNKIGIEINVFEYFQIEIDYEYIKDFYWAGRRIIRLCSSSSKVLRSKLILLWSVSYKYSKLIWYKLYPFNGFRCSLSWMKPAILVQHKIWWVRVQLIIKSNYSTWTGIKVSQWWIRS